MCAAIPSAWGVAGPAHSALLICGNVNYRIARARQVNGTNVTELPEQRHRKHSSLGCCLPSARPGNTTPLRVVFHPAGRSAGEAPSLIDHDKVPANVPTISP